MTVIRAAMTLSSVHPSCRGNTYKLAFSKTNIQHLISYWFQTLAVFWIVYTTFLWGDYPASEFRSREITQKHAHNIYFIFHLHNVSNYININVSVNSQNKYLNYNCLESKQVVPK
jgi:hypothetical protein